MVNYSKIVHNIFFLAVQLSHIFITSRSSLISNKQYHQNWLVRYIYIGMPASSGSFITTQITEKGNYKISLYSTNNKFYVVKLFDF